MDYIGLYIYIYDANIGSINDHHWHHIWSMDLKLPSLEWFSWENLEDTIGFTMVLLSNWLRFPVIFPRNQSNEGLIHKSYGNWRYFHHEEFGTIIYHIYIYSYIVAIIGTMGKNHHQWDSTWDEWGMDDSISHQGNPPRFDHGDEQMGPLRVLPAHLGVWT